MPNKATVRGVLMDATLAPISEGKIIATLSGSDVFEDGVRIVTQKVEATTDATGAWAMAGKILAFPKATPRAALPANFKKPRRVIFSIIRNLLCE